MTTTVASHVCKDIDIAVRLLRRSEHVSLHNETDYQNHLHLHVFKWSFVFFPNLVVRLSDPNEVLYLFQPSIHWGPSILSFQHKCLLIRASVILSIYLSVCPSHAGIVSKRLNLSSNCLHCHVDVHV